MPLRRPHRKSRNGCIECKRRRVKCNEQQPCHNCLKYQSQCVYQTDIGQKQRRSPVSGKDATPTADATASGSVIGAMELLAGPSSLYDFSSTADLALQDLELMHHFTTSVARTLSHRSDIQDTWAIALPKEAYTCDYLMDGLLALSALHIDLAGSEPKRLDYASLSTYHLQRSLVRFREKLANISTANCVPLFGLSSLMVILVCAQYAMENPSRRRESSLSPVAMLVKIFNMCRGVATILAPYRGEMQQCSLRPLLHEDYRLVIDISSGHLPDQSSIEEQTELSALADFIKSQDLPALERTIYLDALSKLTTALRFMYVANEPLEPGAAFVWPILLQREFISLMQRQAPVALVLTAFYCVALHRLDGYWFLSRWCRSLIVEIGDGLSEEMQVWMRWPRRVCGLECAA